jgi:predicted transposase
MFVSLQFKLELKKEDKEKLLQLMRKQSSAIRVAYNMLKELEKEKTKNPHAQVYHGLRQLFPELPTKYIDSAIYKAKQYPTNKSVVFGGKRLFEKLCKNHLQGKAREGIRKQWKEQRQGTLISIGSKADKGNRLARFEDLNGQLHIRITTGNREFIYAKVLREPKSSKDKWITFMAMLLESWQTKNYFAYTVELKLRDGEVYGSVSFELPTPEVRCTKENGVIAIDTNASPIHLAIAEVSKTGESIIGMLKYAPQLNIDKDIAGAYVIGRRALGFKEETPENYERLLKDKAYLEFALKRYEEREKELAELLEKESNEYKRNALESELKNVENAKKLLTNLIQSLQSEPSSCEGADGRNSEQGRGSKASSSAWQVLKVALLFPILGRIPPRDLSPLKPVLVEGVWDRVRSRLAPLEVGGASR